MSWYRKYRPLAFSDLVGQDHIRTILRTALRKGNVSHAYLFSGPRGTGKTSTARIVGKALNCETLTSEGEPCNHCSNCTAINESRLVDVIEIDAASNTGVDHIRDLRDKIGFSPTVGRAKVYIIDEVHMLSMGAFNALLKTLEEPPDFVYFILATTEIHKVPATIQSRCQRFSFRRLTPADIVQRLSYIAEHEKIQVEKAALDIIAAQAGGGLRDAISLFEQQAVSGEVTADILYSQMGLVPQTVTLEFFETLKAQDMSAALGVLDNLVTEGLSLKEFNMALLLFLREKLLAPEISVSERQGMLRLVEIFEEAQKKMRFAVIPQLPLEIAIVKATHSDVIPEAEKGGSRKLFGIFSGEKKAPEKDKEVEKKENASEKETPKKTASREISPEKEEPAGTESGKRSAEFIAPELNLEGVRSAWPQILEKLENSLLRMSLKNAEIVSLGEGVLGLQFPAVTWKEQVEKTGNEQEFLKAFEEVFSQKVKISSTVKSVQLEPTVAEATEEESTDSEGVNPVEMFQEIMGTPVKTKNKEE